VTLAELEDRLQRLPVGDTVLVSEHQFRLAFGDDLPAIQLHEKARQFCQRIGCAAQFIGHENVYVVFTRRPAPQQIKTGAKSN
jgi:hypothetical protein